VNKTAASIVQFAKCILLHVRTYKYSSQLCKHKQKLHVAYLTRAGIIVFLVIN